jgi:hypothetical protein
MLLAIALLFLTAAGILSTFETEPVQTEVSKEKKQ